MTAKDGKDKKTLSLGRGSYREVGITMNDGGDPESSAPRHLGGRSQPIEVLVVTRDDEDGRGLVRELRLLGARVNPVWPMPAQLPVDYEVVFCDLTPDLPSRIPWLPGDPAAALVVIVPEDQPLELHSLKYCAPQSVLHRPIRSQAVQASLLIAQNQFLYEKRLQHKIEKMEETLRHIRTVERAKAIIMMGRNLDEAQAYHQLRKQAMERRTTIGSLAKAIVDSQELLG